MSISKNTIMRARYSSLSQPTKAGKGKSNGIIQYIYYLYYYTKSKFLNTLHPSNNAYKVTKCKYCGSADRVENRICERCWWQGGSR